MDGYIMWPLTTKEGERWVVEQVLESGEFKPVNECDSEGEASVWIKAQLSNALPTRPCSSASYRSDEKGMPPGAG